MKKATAKILALLMVVMLIFSVIPQTYAASGTGYTRASDVSYKIDNGKVANWGARGEDCIFLTVYAINFYTGSNNFENFSQMDGSTNRNNVPSSELYHALQNLMSSRHTYKTNYDELRYNIYNYTDCTMNNTNSISCFYSGKAIGPNWDSGKTWNREHTWPQSKGSNKSTPEGADLMVVRPTASSANGSRGNKAYGESSGYYDPNDKTSYNLRGDCARIMLYTYVRWGTSTHLQNAWGQSGVMESVDVLLDWMEQDPVDTWEMGRNDSVQSITGTRNVFVDYPELAFILFGREVPADMTTPSGQASNMGSTACSHGHTEVRNTKTATCTAAGYTGDTYCTDCGELLSQGKSIAATGHQDTNSDGKCDVCSSNLGNGGAPCRHDREEYRGKENPTCTANGYTGDIHCSACGTLLSKGTVIPATGHQDQNLDGKCDVCSADLGCTHTTTEVKDAKEATCTADGYTGDTVCSSCGVVITAGQVISAAGHTPVVADAQEATCCAGGLTGTTVCSTCGEVLSENAPIPATGEHTFGDWVVIQEPTADAPGKARRTCTVGGFTEEKELNSDGPDSQPKNKTLIYILIGGGVLLVAAAGVVTFIGLKKKKQ